MTHNDIDKLIYLFSKLPGLGPRSARRLVLHLIKYREAIMIPLSDVLSSSITSIKNCHYCGNIDSISPCNICENMNKDHSIICVVETVADLWAIERSNVFHGVYHVLGGTLSVMDGRTADNLNIENLIKRLNMNPIQEIIIATNATIDGQTTAFYLAEKLEKYNIKLSRLAQGIPYGGELDYLDDGTLSAALALRKDLIIHKDLIYNDKE